MTTLFHGAGSQLLRSVRGYSGFMKLCPHKFAEANSIFSRYR